MPGSGWPSGGELLTRRSLDAITRTLLTAAVDLRPSASSRLHDLMSHGVARPAARLVRVERADLDRLARERRRLSVDEALRHRRRAATAMADSFQLVDEFRQAEKRGHRPERQA